MEDFGTSSKDIDAENRDALAKMNNRRRALVASLERPTLSEEEKKDALAQIKDIDEWIETTEGHLSMPSNEEKTQSPRILH